MTPVHARLKIAGTVKRSNMTFRHLFDQVAAHGMPVDKKRSVRDVVKKIGVSRAHFYNALSGRHRVHEDMVDILTAGLAALAPWVTRAAVQKAIETTYRREQNRRVREMAL